MPSLRGSSNFRTISGATIYGLKGNTGPTGPTGPSIKGPTGSTAELILSNITIVDKKLINYFTDGSTLGVTGTLKGITGNTVIYLDGKTGSTGSGFIFYSSEPENKNITIRKIKGTTGSRAYVNLIDSDESITIDVQRYDGEINYSSGIVTQIVTSNFAGNFVGATLSSINYGSNLNVISVLKSSVYEKTKSPSGNTGSLTYTANSDRIIINLDPVNTYNNFSDRNSLAKIFSIDLNQFGSREIEVILENPPQYPIGFSLHIRNGPGISNVSDFSKLIFKTKNNRPVLFPLNKQPCIYRENENYVIHFISIKDNWYGYIFGKVSGNENYFCNNNYQNLTQSSLNAIQFYNGLTGSCCTINGTCEITSKINCDGYFNGIGTTCGVGITGICYSNLGSCCVKNIVDGKFNVYCIENISAYDCLALQTKSVETIFSGNGKTCKDINCQNSFNDVGACCDGKGKCDQLNEIECVSTGGEFLGKGTLCYYNGLTPICSEGIGACCSITGSCSNITASACFSGGGYFQGNGTTCAGVTCTNYLNCGGFLNVSLKPGDLFGGGVVVGIYNPNESALLGAKHAFSRQGITSSFMFGGETFSEYYTSELDFIGYGITGESCITYNTQDVDSYYIIASLQHACVDKNNNFVNPTLTSPWLEKFAWYGTGIAWGPILNLQKYTLDEFTFLDKTYEQYYLQYKEGYYKVTGESLNNIISFTFQSCAESRKNGFDPIARLFTRNVKTSNGLWNRNWGLYNTIRMISADNADYLKLTDKPYITGGFTSGNELTAAKLIRFFNNNDFTNSYGLTGNPSQLSDWYIPSHDELAFIAANCISDGTNKYSGFNLNSYLLLNDGIPFYDWYWSSTGSFNTDIENEGIYNNNQITKHGSVAWALYFDINGDSTNFKCKKENRSELLKVRAIRAIRCDGKIPSQNTPEYKLWKVPKLLRNNK